MDDKILYEGIVVILILIQRMAIAWGSVVGIATAYGLDNREVGFRVPVG
jgi:hypothetical protein